MRRMESKAAESASEVPVPDRGFLTFDCYGTLVDWRQGIAGACLAKAAEIGVAMEREEILRLHAEIEPRVQAGPFASYRSVLTETARRIFATRDVELADDARFLAESLPGWPPFADSRPALERLRRAGYRLGILSNVDDDLLAGTRERLGVEFDLLVTAQAVGSYKPAPGHFEEARRRIAGASWTHVAQSLFHDVEPARRLGIATVWIDRLGETPPRHLTGVERYGDLSAFAAARVR